MAALIGDRVGSWEEAKKYFPKIFPFQTFYISEGQLQPPELDNSLLSPTQKGQPNETYQRNHQLQVSPTLYP